MKKILLINTPFYNNQDMGKSLPLGISYLASALRNTGYYCEILDGCLNNLLIEEIVKISLKFDLIGISSCTINFPHAIEIAKMIKQKDNKKPVILGGHHATFEHEIIIKQYKCFDAIIRGEGESIIIELCKDVLENNSFTHQLKGVTYYDINGETVISNEINYEEDLDRLVFPARDNLEKYHYENFDGKKRLCVNISTSRGCPYGCVFCATTSFRYNWLSRTAENVVDEVYLLYKKYRDIFILFVDDNFYVDPNRSKDIIHKINKKCNDIVNFRFATRADQIVTNGTEYLRFLKENGCRIIELGIENGSDDVLKRYCKNTTVEINKNAIQMIRNHGIHVDVDYILFDPKITIEELKDNIEFMKNSNIWGDYFPKVYNKVVPYPGTKFKQVYGDISLKYFSDEKAEQVYNHMIKFSDAYQGRINSLIEKINLNFNLKQNKIPKKDYIWLRTIPYELLNHLVTCSSDYNEAYETFVNQNNVNKYLCKMEN